MFNRHLHFCLVASAVLLLTGCSKPVTDYQGRKLPAVGQPATLIEKHGWLATSENSLAELMTPPKIDLMAVPPDRAGQMLDAALEQNASRLKQEGKLIQVSTGSKVRILGYYNGDAHNIRPVAVQDQNAMWVKVEILEGEASRKMGFSTADGVAE